MRELTKEEQAILRMILLALKDDNTAKLTTLKEHGYIDQLWEVFK